MSRPALPPGHLGERQDGAEDQLAALRAAAERLGCVVVPKPRKGDARAELLRAVHEHWPGGAPMAADLVERARVDAVWRRALLAFCPPRGGAEMPTRQSLGCKLRGAKGVEIDGYVIEVATREKGGRAWTRRRVAE